MSDDVRQTNQMTSTPYSAPRESRIDWRSCAQSARSDLSRCRHWLVVALPSPPTPSPSSNGGDVQWRLQAFGTLRAGRDEAL
ncbi:hypothetical protein HZH66_000015 [Vespula vulgaris]|uniref:Uncharacterized protein n=1 Tax=Vespula vulgaris TaxID=7454 RepID=A0A834KTQ7_VESVU|nr:hypothetical protein HZH66_000015 [Vespula vulgaris]